MICEEAIFREIRDEDTENIVPLISDALYEIVSRQTLPVLAEYMQRTLNVKQYIKSYSETGKLFVFELESRILGTIAMVFPEHSWHDYDNFPEIKILYVLPTYRNRGCGRKIMADSEKYAIETCFTGFVVNADQVSQKFYESMGFKKVGEPYQMIKQFA